MVNSRRELPIEMPTPKDGSLPLSISRPAVLVEGRDRDFRRLIHRMIITEGRLIEIRRAIGRQVGVSGTQYTMLMAVLHLQGESGISIGGIAGYLEVTGPHVTGEIRKLAAKGLVRKLENPNDKRGVLVKLSGEGRKRLLRAFDFIRNVNDILFDGVTGDEFRSLSRFHQKFINNTNLALEWTRRPSRIARQQAAE